MTTRVFLWILTVLSCSLLVAPWKFDGGLCIDCVTCWTSHWIAYPTHDYRDVFIIDIDLLVHPHASSIASALYHLDESFRGFSASDVHGNQLDNSYGLDGGFHLVEVTNKKLTLWIHTPCYDSDIVFHFWGRKKWIRKAHRSFLSFPYDWIAFSTFRTFGFSII